MCKLLLVDDPALAFALCHAVFAHKEKVYGCDGVWVEPFLEGAVYAAAFSASFFFARRYYFFLLAVVASPVFSAAPVFVDLVQLHYF
jgi:hypothetical protein